MTVYQKLHEHKYVNTYRFIKDGQMNYAVGRVIYNILYLVYVSREELPKYVARYDNEPTWKILYEHEEEVIL